MNRIISVCFFLFFAFSLVAQTNNPLIFGAASGKNKKMQITGTILTAVGGVTLFAGNIMYWKLYNDDNNSAPPQDKVDTSVYFILGGLGLMAVGIPLLVIGKTNERNIRIEANLGNYNGSTPIKGIGVKIRF
jgi:hypothetical protein